MSTQTTEMTITQQQLRELIAAATEANRWLGKAVADNLFEGHCVAPNGAKVTLDRLHESLKAVR